MTDRVDLEFKGYYLEKSKGGIPAQSGIYCVYRSVYSASSDTVSLKELLYIGESANMKDRVANHEKEKDWKKHLGRGETLSFSYTAILSGRERTEAALIYKHKPIENSEYRNSFPFRSLRVITSGRNWGLKKDFTVLNTNHRDIGY